MEMYPETGALVTVQIAGGVQIHHIVSVEPWCASRARCVTNCGQAWDSRVLEYAANPEHTTDRCKNCITGQRKKKGKGVAN